MCCKKRVKRRVPLVEVWKRRLVLSSICFVILTLGGLVMMAVELTKLQRNIYGMVTIVGFSITVGGLLPLYLILTYTVCGHDQYPTGPVLIWANALYMLIGIALVCVAQIVPADSMFNMIPFNSAMERNNFSGLYPLEEDEIFSDLLAKYGEDITIQKNQVVWDRGLIDVIQFRVSILGGGIFGTGLFGSALTITIIYKVHSLIEKMKRAEHTRRKNIRTLAKAFKPRNQGQPLRRLRRDSVYDYAGWGNRTSDIFHDHDAEGRVSSTSSTKLTSTSMISIAEEGANQRNSRRVSGIYRNYEYVPEYPEEEALNGDAVDRRFSGKSYEGMGISSIEMKQLNTQIKNNVKTV
uniref:uncharacterized protein LOC120331646 isoform X1 n=1 Tax=Styela clava TaxID=7725 RepID=UPI0019393C2C|nr:uncharacterized protein LOC120331646 isoform X1 [Styela clava]